MEQFKLVWTKSSLRNLKGKQKISVIDFLIRRKSEGKVSNGEHNEG